jgi:hypothetical protein
MTEEYAPYYEDRGRAEDQQAIDEMSWMRHPVVQAELAIRDARLAIDRVEESLKELVAMIREAGIDIDLGDE